MLQKPLEAGGGDCHLLPGLDSLYPASVQMGSDGEGRSVAGVLITGLGLFWALLSGRLAGVGSDQLRSLLLTPQKVERLSLRGGRHVVSPCQQSLVLLQTCHRPGDSPDLSSVTALPACTCPSPAHLGTVKGH